MKKLTITILSLVLFLFISCSKNPKAEQLKAMRERYDKLTKRIEWYKGMHQYWEGQTQLGELSYQAYADTLSSELAMLKRQAVLIDSIAILEGKDPNAWKKPPSE